jgi:predicted nucleotidyltransferase
MAQAVDYVAERREVADTLTRQLSTAPGVTTVVLYGSTARGDANAHSDVDLLVIIRGGADPDPIRQTCRDAQPAKVSLTLHDTDTFAQLKNDDWLFVRHLHDEGLVLWEQSNEFRKRSAVPHPGDRVVVGEILDARCELDQLRQLERYGSDFLFPLADAYAVSKRVAILANARLGISIFQRERALAMCAENYPKVLPDIERIARLAPFYARTRGDRNADAEFSSDGAAAELLGALASLERVIETVSVA